MLQPKTLRFYEEDIIKIEKLKRGHKTARTRGFAPEQILKNWEEKNLSSGGKRERLTYHMVLW